MNSFSSRWLPAPGALLWLVFFLAVSFSPQRATLVGADGDACWHWRQGNWMLEHRAILRADEFSHTRPGAPLIEMWWLSELLFAAAGNALGWNGVVILSAALIATTLALLQRYLRNETGDPLIAVLATLLAAAACASHWLARPHLFTHLLTVVFAGELRRYDLATHPQSQGDRIQPGEWRLFRLLPGLMIAWANLHGGFVTGLVLVGVYALASVRRPQQCWRWAGLGALCLAASLINPQGWRLHAHILAYLRSPVLVGFVDEYASPNFHEPAQLGFLLLLLVLVLTLARGRTPFTAAEILLAAVFGCLALQSVRNVPTFALVVTPLIAVRLRPAFGLTPRGGTAERTPEPGAPWFAATGWVWVAVTLGVTVYVAPRWQHTALRADRYPVAAVRFLQGSKDAVHGEMFNDLVWGGYFLLEMPRRKVFIDGRIDFYGERMIEDFNAIDNVQPDWEAVAARYDVGWTILPPHHPLNAVLALHPAWQPVYNDAVAVIFTRGSP